LIGEALGHFFSGEVDERSHVDEGVIGESLEQVEENLVAGLGVAAVDDQDFHDSLEELATVQDNVFGSFDGRVVAVG
jgi:hypothetical protein